VPTSEIVLIRRRTGPGGRPLGDLYTLGNSELQPKQPFDPNRDEFVGTFQLADAVLLTNSCEMDNSPKANLTFALIRPLRTVPEEHRDAMVSGDNARVLYLPANDDPEFEESYIDFSRLSSLRPDAVQIANRVVSATEGLMKGIYVGFVRYVTRFVVEGDEIEALVQKAIDEAAD
jgi:hypothetical protein